MRRSGQRRSRSLSAVPGSALVPDRVLVTAAVFLTAALFLTTAADPVNVVKLTALVVCALGLAGLAVVRAVAERVIRLPTGPAAWTTVALAVGFIASAVGAPQITIAVLGTLGRNSGLLAYGSALVVFLAVLRTFDSAATRWIAYGVGAAGLYTTAYGAFQLAGIDAVGWSNPFNPAIAAMGNPNFAAAYMGIAVPVAAWGAWRADWSLAWRMASGATGVLCLVVATLSESVQGPIAALAGLTVFALAVLLDQPDRVRRIGLAVLGVAAAAGSLLLALGLSGAGPGAAFFSGISYRARTWYWSAAAAMLQDKPVLGVGLDSYGPAWRQLRPLESARELGGDHFSDAAHNVPLQMFAQGGLLLGLTYLAFVAAVGVSLVQGLRRLAGAERLLLGGVGGAWLAYQVQSIVSIDQVPLLVVHFALAGAVVVISGGVRLREIRLPGALPIAPPPDTGRSRRRAVALPKVRTPDGFDYGVMAVTGIVVLVGMWFALVPLRGSMSVYAGDVARSAGRGTESAAAYDRATDLVPGLGFYWNRMGELYNQAGVADKALAAFASGAEHEPDNPSSVRSAGRLAQATGDLAAARTYFERGLELEPTNDKAVLDLARFQLEQGESAAARDLLERAVRDLPTVPSLWAGLGDARRQLSDASGAKQAYDRALVLQPGESTAVQGLTQLAATATAR